METQENAAKSPEAIEKVKKRRRPPLSCVPCHRRKLKCDRGFPACGRCRKADHAHDCVYRERSDQMPLAREKLAILESTVNSRPETLIGVEETAQHIITKTTRLTEEPCQVEASENDETQVREVTLYKGKDSLTRFYGYSYHRNLYQQVCSQYKEKINFEFAKSSLHSLTNFESIYSNSKLNFQT